ncbi:MAG: lasso peptide biosynthesis B2 protein [Acidobacteriaceae bacterium]
MKAGEPEDFPEFELVLACLRWPQQYVDSKRIRLLAQRELRWSYLLQIVNHHKVVPLFFRNLEGFAADYLPDAPAAALRTWAGENAGTCLRLTNHFRLLNRRFREQAIDLRIFKGIPLAIAAFQDAALRDAGDIDLLVSEQDIFRAEEILLDLGYSRREPQALLTPRRVRSYLAHQKDFSYSHGEEHIDIDLHWRLLRNPFLPSNAGLGEVGTAWLTLGDDAIATLPTPRLLLYLCLHGALDGWLRLKWLADMSALLRTMAAEELADVVQMAKEQQALPAFSAACILGHDLLGNDVPPGCLDRGDRKVAQILRFSRQVIASNHFRPIREEIPSSQWFLNEFRLYDSLRYRLDLIARSLFRPRVWSRYNLPDRLFPLYALLSPVDWVMFHLGRRLPGLRRILRPPGDIGLAIEAGCMLTFFRIALNFLPVQKLTAWMSRGNTQRAWVTQETAAQTMRRIEWSIDAVVRHAPLTFVCFPQCLAAYFMLRRRHIASKLFYGVAREANQLKAHTWVKVGDRTIVGGDVESHFTVLTVFP